MGVFKIKPGDLMKGANIDWPSVALQTNPGMAMPVRHGDKKNAEPVRYPTMDKAGLADFQAQGNGEAGLSAKEPNQKQYEKIAAARAEGNLPEQVVKTPVDRTQRSAVDAENIIDPVRQARVNRLAGMIQSDNTATAPGTVDSYDKMLEFLKARQQVDADADKRARRREMIAAIGDGISAISSLYQTTQGAPVTYTPGKDMSEVMRQRYDRYMAQRKADEDKYLNYLKVQHAAEQDRESQEYRRQMAEIRREEMESRAEVRKERQQLAKDKEARLKQAAEDKQLSQIGKAVYPTRYEFYRVQGYDDQSAHDMAMKDAADALEAQQKMTKQKVENDTKRAGASAQKAATQRQKEKRMANKAKSKTPGNSTSKNKKKKPLGTNPQGL